MPSLNPIPSFPSYTGPHKVGTLDVEIPVSDLPSPARRPDNADHIVTVQFRVFYPADEDAAKGPKASWLPLPQREHVLGYTKFVGANSLVAEVLSYIPRHLYYTSIPATKNSPLLPHSTPTGKYPLILFSHGLGGSRNAYSHTAGSLASHGCIVVCPEHRDGSAVASFIRIPEKQPPGYFSHGSSQTSVPYRRISHEVSDELYEAREAQLRIRLWEMALVYEAVLKIDRGQRVTNLNASTTSLDGLRGVMDLRPGKVVFAGHSFGSATMIQLLKSTFHADSPALRDMKHPLFKPEETANLRTQITEHTPSILLDIWTTPMIGPNSTELLHLPLPAYSPSGPGGTAILAVLSEAFFKWKPHLRMTARILSPTPSTESLTEESYRCGVTGRGVPEPRIFYVRGSAHISQSDFGLLFPRLIKRAFKVVDPGRVTRLNLRAMLQFLRGNDVPVGRTCKENLAEGTSSGTNSSSAEGVDDDAAIFDKEGVEAWEFIDTVAVFNEPPSEGERESGETTEEDMEEELRKPALAEPIVEATRHKVDRQEMPMPRVDRIGVEA